MGETCSTDGTCGSLQTCCGSENSQTSRSSVTASTFKYRILDRHRNSKSVEGGYRPGHGGVSTISISPDPVPKYTSLQIRRRKKITAPPDIKLLRDLHKNTDLESKMIVFGYIRRIQSSMIMTDDNDINEASVDNKEHFSIPHKIYHTIPYHIHYGCLTYYFEPRINPLPRWFVTEYSGEINLCAKVGIFIRTLPQKSRCHIWEHSVKHKLRDGTKVPLPKTQHLQHITALLADCIIVYIKYVHRDKDPLKSRATQEWIRDAAVFIHDKYHPLIREQHEDDNNYLADMLVDYVNSRS